MFGKSPDDERPVTRKEFRFLALSTAGGFICTSLALACLLALDFTG
ncbi:hypothetical protein [Streptomyces tirandamycinicus]|nr:hypothetical protein [Streptomyces tirandamycinicus]